MRKAVTCLAIKNQHCQICQKHFSLKSNNVMVWHRPVQTKPVSFLLEHNAISSFFQRNQSSIRHISATSNNSLVPNSPLVKEQNWTQSIPASTFRYSCRRFSNETEPLLHNLCQVDKYNGITVDLNDLPQDFSVEEFRQLLTESLQLWKSQGRSCIWIKVPIHKSLFIASAAQFGFEFHHAEHLMSLLKLWLNSNVEDKTPRFATHQIGVSGMVYREDTKEILVVKDRASQFSYWKFPGGLSDLEEDIDATAEREVLEETGIKSEFLSVLAFRQQHHQPGAFGRSDIFVVCRLKPLNFNIDHCHNEISHCKWMSLEELYTNTAEISPITHRMCQLLLSGLQNGFNEIDIKPKEMKSIYKGLKYKLYHRPLTDI